MSTDNSYLDPYEDVFESTTVQPPPFPFLWLLVFCTIQLFPWFAFYILVDAFLNSLVLLASFILLRVAGVTVGEGQVAEEHRDAMNRIITFTPGIFASEGWHC